jgi:3-hydroxyisobutyrate dehydrogenase-like beta-hydroxyacid dehydrogenase
MGITQWDGNRIKMALPFSSFETKGEMTPMTNDYPIGFIGLGNMGRPMAGHIAAKGHPMIVYDLAGTGPRAPAGARIAQSNTEVAQQAGIIVLSLPNVAANAAVVDEIAQTAAAGTLVVDTCTIGVAAAQRNAQRLQAAGIDYLDAPVSGLAMRAQEGTLATMCSGPEQTLERARAVLESYSRIVFRVGGEPGQGQRMKLVNNALCITQYVITSEALAYGENGGLDLQTMLEVINESSGMNFSTSMIFPKYVVTERYSDSGSEAHVPSKDIGLFVDGAQQEGTPHAAVAAAYEIFKAFADEDPRRDQMWIYPYVKGDT